MSESAAKQINVFNQHTLNEQFSFVGRGLHTGLRVIMSVLPAEPNTGYVFTRRDVHPSRGVISAGDGRQKAEHC